MKYCSILFLVLISYSVLGQLSITPAPQKVIYNDSVLFFEFDKANMKALATQLKSRINEKYDSIIGDEGYKIKVLPTGIVVSANTSHGLYYGMRTLDIISEQQTDDKGIVRFRCCTIIDYPKYAYRGMHLDVCRHFFSKEVVKKYIDELAKNKMNYFHWHLTDDQAWRIQIKKYPRLTEVGAWRTEKDGSKYGGFYTQEDIKEIVSYAAERNITIVPEIEMPGHSSAAVAAYPWLSCSGKEINVPNHWGIFKDIYCPSDTAIGFMRNVLDEVCTLFPGPYIHLGGDEVPKEQWQASPLVQKLKAAKKLANEEEVQHYFMKQMEDYLSTKGKRAIGWGEIVRGGLSSSTIVMSWMGKTAGIKAAQNGNNVIMAPRLFCYFDYPQSKEDKKSAWWMAYLPVKKVYSFSPATGSSKLDSKVLGGEATLWTEYVTNENRLWHQLKPRIAAMGEALWGTNKNWADFNQRIKRADNK